MNIELTDAEISAVKQKVVNRVAANVEQQLMAQFQRMVNGGEMVSEVKNKAATKACALPVEKVEKKIQADELMKRCIDSVQGRVNLKIHTLLEKGITIKFDESLS